MKPEIAESERRRDSHFRSDIRATASIMKPIDLGNVVNLAEDPALPSIDSTKSLNKVILITERLF